MSQQTDTSLTGFYKVMNQKEKKTFWGCFLGLGIRWHGFHDLSIGYWNHYCRLAG